MRGRHAEPIVGGVEGGDRAFESRLGQIGHPAMRGYPRQLQHDLDIGGLQTG